MLPNKVCPVILRRNGTSIDVLAFEHPLAGCQLIKGTVETDEPLEIAALRELAEESGVRSARVIRCLGTWSSGYENQTWVFFECAPAQALPESWTHHAPDDGGHAFQLFWQPLFAQESPQQWHFLFRGALNFIREAI
jgi:ADP-ribose pyrophosphatase YjhB (NUDIX family)